MGAKKPFSPWFYVTAMALVLVLNVLGLMLLQAYLLERIELSLDALVVVGAGLAAAGLFWLILMLVFWYRAWDTIQDGHARTTPGKAIGFLFIPLFNVYWFFQLTLGFCSDYNKFLERRGIQLPRLPIWPWLALVILGTGAQVVMRLLPGGFLNVNLAAVALACVPLYMLPFVQAFQGVAALRRRLSGIPVPMTRPVCARAWTWALVMVALFAAGEAGARMFLFEDKFAKEDAPTIQVSARLPGAYASTMAEKVALELEKEFDKLEQLESMSSTSVYGATDITLRFSPKRDVDAALADVQAAVTRAQPRLPAGVSTPISCRAVYPTALPVLYLVLTSSDGKLPLPVLHEYAETVVMPRVSALRGVGPVEIRGGQEHAVRVTLDMDKLAAQDITVDEVAAALKARSSGAPASNAERPATEADPGVAQLGFAREIGDTVIATRPAQTVRIGDVAKVVGDAELMIAAWRGDRDGQQRCILLAIGRRQGFSSAGVVAAVRKMLPALGEVLPASVRIQTFDPREEGRVILCDTGAATGTRVEHASRLLEFLWERLLKEPDVESYVAATSSYDPSGERAVLLVRLRASSPCNVQQVVESLRPLARIPELAVWMRAAGQPLCKYTLQGADTEALVGTGWQLGNSLSEITMLRDVRSDGAWTSQWLNSEVDYDCATRLDVSAEKIADALKMVCWTYAVPGNAGSRNPYPVIVGLDRPWLPHLADRIRLRDKDGRPVRLSALMRVQEHTQGLLVIRHTGLLPSVTLYWSLAPGVRRAAAKALVEEKAREVLPPGITGRWTD